MAVPAPKPKPERKAQVVKAQIMSAPRQRASKRRRNDPPPKDGYLWDPVLKTYMPDPRILSGGEIRKAWRSPTKTIFSDGKYPVTEAEYARAYSKLIGKPQSQFNKAEREKLKMWMRGDDAYASIYAGMANPGDTAAWSVLKGSLQWAGGVGEAVFNSKTASERKRRVESAWKKADFNYRRNGLPSKNYKDPKHPDSQDRHHNKISYRSKRLHKAAPDLEAALRGLGGFTSILSWIPAGVGVGYNVGKVVGSTKKGWQLGARYRKARAKHAAGGVKDTIFGIPR